MQWLQFLWLPSALLAWPIARWIRRPDHDLPAIAGDLSVANAVEAVGISDGSFFQSSGEELLRKFVFSIACLLLLCLVLGFVQRATAEKNPSSKLAKVAYWRLGWLIAQPFLLVLLGWPELVSQGSGNFYESSILLLGASLPTMIFDLLVRPSGAQRHALGNFPMVALLTVAVVAETLVLLRATVYESVSTAHALDLSATEVGSLGHRSVDTTNLMHQIPTSNIDSVGVVLVMIVSGCLTMFMVPMWMSWATQSEELQDDERIEHWKSLWRSLQIDAPKIVFWPTNHTYANAVIVSGLKNRKLFLTDRLLTRYSLEEIDLILLHEIAHVMRRHHWVRLFPALLIVPVILLVLQAFHGLWLGVACLVVLVLFLGLILFTCCWTEMDADRHAIRLACELLGMDPNDAKNSFVAVLQRIYSDNRIDRTSWSHPRLSQRIEALK